jgi:signal recognition particle receptor subunit beta
MPYALQFNKRDLPSALPVTELYRTLNYKREPTFEAVATTGVGVFDTLKAVAKQILIELRKR